MIVLAGPVIILPIYKSHSHKLIRDFLFIEVFTRSISNDLPPENRTTRFSLASGISI